METTIGNMGLRYSARGIPSYEIEMSHEGLHKHRVIRGPDSYIVQRKSLMQAEAWDEAWSKRESINRARSKQAEAKELALETTKEAQHLLQELRLIVLRTLEVDDAIDWNLLKNTDDFPLPFPVRRVVSQHAALPPPAKPDRNQSIYQPDLTLWEKFLSKFGRPPTAKIEMAERRFQRHIADWKDAVASTAKWNKENDTRYESALIREQEEFDQNVQTWQGEKEKYFENQKELNKAVDLQREAYTENEEEAVKNYCEMVLSNSLYPTLFPQEFELLYDARNAILAVDYLLPSLDAIPTLTEVKYVAARNEFSEKHLSDLQKSKLYDDVIYQTALRTVHELYEADTVNALSSIVFNGYVSALSRATGQQETNCIISLQAGREEFLAINLSAVDPRVCFRQLKGVAAAKLFTMTAVPPLMKLNKEDNRFVGSYDVATFLNEGVNLAAMGWEDFEHLIRELFEKEFCVNGGEVRVTQASRDGGVDAVAFDPDPIRGGKIVIQAKRYTNTVGVSAVRDLYGTILNEGATKGILVTTSDYGPDAYEFARNKPITLVNGGNLLFLLQKHGSRAKIDLKEAKEFFNAQK